jgi:glutathione S-transferase
MLGLGMAGTTPKLYVLPASHPCVAVEAALALKSIPFERVDMLPLSQMLIGPLRYGGITAPGMRIGKQRLVGSRAIMRRLDELAPEPPLLPAPGEPRYARVLEVERWGDEVFQDVPRHVLGASLLRSPASMESYVGDAKLPLPIPLLRPAAPLTARLLVLRASSNEVTVRADLAALPRQLERIDGWMSEGLLGGEHPNAADLQIGSAIRLLMSVAQLRPSIERHPAAKLARYFPPIAGEIPAGTLPADWLAAPLGA